MLGQPENGAVQEEEEGQAPQGGPAEAAQLVGAALSMAVPLGKQFTVIYVARATYFVGLLMRRS